MKMCVVGSSDDAFKKPYLPCAPDSAAKLRCGRGWQALSAEEAQARQHALAKMRSLLLRHTHRAKHLKKIKSKDFHRRANRTAKLKVGRLCMPV